MFNFWEETLGDLSITFHICNPFYLNIYVFNVFQQKNYLQSCRDVAATTNQCSRTNAVIDEYITELAACLIQEPNVSM